MQDAKKIKRHVRKHYASLFEKGPPGKLPIRTGKELAEHLGYPADLIRSIPDAHWEYFLPCGNPIAFVDLSAGDRVLNLGCGAGIDSYALTGRGQGTTATVVGMDLVPSILVRARTLALPPAPHWVCADGEHLPFHGRCFDWVVLNGVFNLFPDKSVLLVEIRRVLKPGGRVVCTDLCRTGPLPDYFHDEPDAWAWCMSGACTREELLGMLDEAQFKTIDFRCTEDLDLFYRFVILFQKGV